MHDDFTPILHQLSEERDECERHIARHKNLGPAYSRGARERIARIDREEAELFAARRRSTQEGA